MAKRRKRKPERCALCGKKLPLNKQHSVIGTTGQAVCKRCLEAAGCIQLFQEREQRQARVSLAAPELLSPQQLVAQLDKRIIGQTEAKNAIAIALWKQQLRAAGHFDVPRSTLLLHGPTGCGKTALVREAARLVGLPFIAFDSTTLSETGYRGRDAQEIVKDLVHAYPDDPKTPYGVVLLDEIDKLSAREGNDYRAAYSRGTQHALLKLIEGDEVWVTNERKIDTEGLLFVFGGAFSGIERYLARPTQSVRAIGFGRERMADDTPDIPSALMPTTETFISYGLEPELLGRFTRRVGLSALTQEDLRRILLESDLSTYRRYQTFFRSRGVELALDNAHLDQWISDALALGTGARGLQSIVEQAMEPLLFRLADREIDAKEDVWYA